MKNGEISGNTALKKALEYMYQVLVPSLWMEAKSAITMSNPVMT